MSFQFEGQKCPVCHAYLFEEDDIVCCPECGAPHHRDCYQNIGHCALAETHGTAQQYHVEKTEVPPERESETHRDTVKCQMCGEEYESGARSCPKCGTPNFGRMSSFSGFDFLGGVPADMDLGEGVTADEAKRFVMANTTRYIPKFAEMKSGKKSSWNLLGFLFPCGWFCSRKMYRNGIIAGALQTAFTLLLFPLGNVLNANGQTNPGSYAEIFSIFSKNLSTGIFAIIGAVLLLAVGLVTGIFGDNFYRHHVLNQIGKIKTESEDEDYDYHRLGGVSIFGMLIGILAINYLPGLIFTLI